jgi:hypothetical protein
LVDLTKRLKAWHENWDGVVAALARDSFLRERWPVRPWLFVPSERIPLLVQKLNEIAELNPALKFLPKTRPLEMVQPWRYNNFNRVDEDEKMHLNSMPFPNQ